MSSRSIDIILASLAESTYKQYDSCIRSWIEFCNKNKCDYFNSSVATIIDFLTMIFDRGAKYGTINSYKSALALILGSIVSDPQIQRFMKGVYRLRPTAPKYSLTWNPNTVLTYLANKWPNESLDLVNITRKTVTLLALVTAHRVQTLSLINLNNIHIYDNDEIIIKIPDLIKSSKVNSLQPVLKLPFFNERPEICPARALMCYIEKTKCLRQANQNFLFISCKHPFSKISSQRLSHWVKETLQSSGIDTSVFTAHSARHAATSSAKKLGLNIETIKKTAGWSQASSVFARFYNKEIVDDPNQFARIILSCSN